MSVSSASAAGSPTRDGSASGEKGLKAGALGFVSNVVIGVASTAPGYSLAATLGFVVAIDGVGVAAPAVFVVAFLPMLCIAMAYSSMNRADPDCGTTFTWVTRALGPYLGWMGGWGIVAAGTIVMANLGQIAGLYSFKLLGLEAAAESTAAVTALGVLFIAVMTLVCVIGIELSARTQVLLLGAEIAALGLFAVVALVKVYAGDAGPQAIDPALGWLNPFEIASTEALSAGVLLAVFVYWGWDSTVSVNEESENPATMPGRAAVVSTLVLLGIYVLVAVAAQAFSGPTGLLDAEDALGVLATGVFGTPLDRIVILAVLTSAAASCLTTILPNARTALSMARHGAAPRALGVVHPRSETPHVATLLFGALAIGWYVVLTLISEDILADSIAALGLMIAFYYALTGYACVVYYRRELRKSVRNAFLVGVAPFVGATLLAGLFYRSCRDLSAPDAGSGTVLGVGTPLVVGLGFLLLGAVLMLVWRLLGHREFFSRRREVADPAVLARGAPVSGRRARGA
jgi:amino acid transporter